MPTTPKRRYERPYHPLPRPGSKLYIAQQAEKAAAAARKAQASNQPQPDK